MSIVTLALVVFVLLIMASCASWAEYKAPTDPDTKLLCQDESGFFVILEVDEIEEYGSTLTECKVL
jgi:hypothetical protein